MREPYRLRPIPSHRGTPEEPYRVVPGAPDRGGQNRPATGRHSKEPMRFEKGPAGPGRARKPFPERGADPGELGGAAGNRHHR